MWRLWRPDPPHPQGRAGGWAAVGALDGPGSQGVPRGHGVPGGMNEGDLATLLHRACRDAGHPITVAASRHAAAEALTHLDPPPPMTRWPALMVELHEHVRPWEWARPGLLAARLRSYADALEARAHAAMVEDAAA